MNKCFISLLWSVLQADNQKDTKIKTHNRDIFIYECR